MAMPVTSGGSDRPPLKRRRIEAEGKLARQVERDGADLRESLSSLHQSLSERGDIVVVVQGLNESCRFPCVSALLASASRPLAAMLYGTMCALVHPPEGGRSELHLHGTEPWCFDQLLRYIHGQSIPLDVDIAVHLHHVADYYEVLQLRDSCCAFLLDALRPHNCCQLLARSQDVHCEPLAARCLYFLTLDFPAVVEHDPDLATLEPSVLASVLSRNELVCTSEWSVFEAVVKWYTLRPRAEKFHALPELLGHIRWHMINAEARQKAVELVANLRPPASKPAEEPGRRPLGPAAAGGSGATERALERAVDLGGVVMAAARKADAEKLTGSVTGTRQQHWGRLVGRSPQEGSASPRVLDEHELVCTKEYMVGRSRKTDIRVGQNAPMPYISSHHFRIFHAIRWPEQTPTCDLTRPANPPPPVLEPWLEDLSQNGTFINGILVGRNKKVLLRNGDRIELVFPQNRTQATPGASTFPTYTFSSPLPAKGSAPLPAASSSTSHVAEKL